MSSSLTFSARSLAVNTCPGSLWSLVPRSWYQNWIYLKKNPALQHTLSQQRLIKLTNHSTATHRTGKVYRMLGRAFPDLEASNTEYQENDGIVIVDHGSRRAESNSMLSEFVDMFKWKTGHANVEPAHMELASPTIKEAFDRCVLQGATRVIIVPYFLFPGRHWDKDIPALAAEAAKMHPTISYLVTGPIGLHELMVNVLQDRVNHCLSQVAGKISECEMCAGTGRCKVLQISDGSQ